MNTTGCSAAGYASDELFQRSPLSCDTPLATYWAVALSLTAYRVMLVALRATTWAVVHRNHAGRWPLTPALSALVALSYVLLVPMGGTNVVNYANGTSYVVFCFGYLGFALQTLIVGRGAIRLGARIIPVMGKSFDAPSLRRLDAFGQALFVTQVACILGSMVALIVLSPTIPANEDQLATAAFYLKFIFHTAVAGSIAWFYERIVRAVQAHQATCAAPGPTPGEPNDASSLTPRSFDAVVRRLRRIQAQLALGLFPPGIFYVLLATRVLPWTYVFVLVIPGWFEALGSTVDDVATLRRHLRKRWESTSGSKKLVAAEGPLGQPGPGQDHKELVNAAPPGDALTSDGATPSTSPWKTATVTGTVHS